jgi:serine/threonine-protein kinase
MDKLIKPIRTLLGIEQGEIPAISTGEVAGAPVVVPAPRDEPSSMHISNFRCPERGEEFEIYVRTLEKDFRAYDPNFVIEKWLGSGGFCDVFLVPDVNIPGKGRRRAVLRVLRPTIYRTTRPEVNNSNIRLFLTEMGYNLFLSSQNAPHVVKMYDFGFFGRKAGEPRHLYMIMQYVEGEDIAVRWRRRPSDEKELVKRVVQVNQIAGIVGELHFRGIIHCDLKPTNILMQGDQPILTDFGSARWMHVSDAVGDMAMQVPGTQSYMSYEQLQGEYYRLDQRTDIFSLAVLACYAFTGVNPFEGRAAVDIDKDERGLGALCDVEPQVPRIPYRNGDSLRNFLLECLSRDLEQRPATMVEFQQRLNAWILES